MAKDNIVSDLLSVSVGQYSSAGRKPVNQDFHGCLVPSGVTLGLKGITLAIADGISSSAVSGEAAETAVKSLLNDYYATPDAWVVRTAATRVIAATNAWLHGQNTSVADVNAGRVCTLSALILKGREGHVLHVGDSRVMRLLGKGFERLTDDHRIVMSASESYLARAMGAEPEVDVDYTRVELAVGDIFLLTTDGVHEFISAVTARTVIDNTSDLDAAAEAIATVALDHGSPDNLTIQIVRIETLPSADAGFALETADLPIPPLPKPGDVLDGYRVVRPVLSTARSHVFLAADADGHKVALKIPATETGQDSDYRRRFVLEEWIARRVSSANVLSAPPVAERRALYVVTDWVEGITLRQWMIDHPAPSLDEVRDIVTQIATGLRAMNRREMIHQDLRPENVMIDPDGTVKIIDLGSAAVAGVEEAAPGLLGQMPGTFQYTAPEYLSGDAVSWRSDQFALGVIVYEMLTGRLPYGTQVARVRSRVDQKRLRYRPARDDASSVPAWIDAALRKAVHPDPLRRYDALSEFVADLKRPGAGWQATQHVPLAERNPVRFWQTVSGLLAVLCLILALQLAT